MKDVTRILSAIEHGDAGASERLLALVYDELRRLASHKLTQEKPGQTLQATALVHEAYLRLVDIGQAQHWNSRGHFFAAAAEAMRRILVDSARRKHAEKRGGKGNRIDLDAVEAVTSAPPEGLLALDEALEVLGQRDALSAQLVKLRYFAGLSAEQAGAVLGLSRANAYRKLTFARAWLRWQVAGESRDESDLGESGGDSHDS
jgi:RNA polymerase sigma factor (TIGR02999 family)